MRGFARVAGKRSGTGPAAFTLIEMMIVIVIIMLLAGILLPTLYRAKTLAKRRQSEAGRNALVTAVRNYHFNNRKWPVPEGDLGASPDRVYSADNWKVIERLTNAVPPMLDVGDFRRDAAGNVVDSWGNPYTIQIDTDYDRTPVDGVRVHSANVGGWSG